MQRMNEIALNYWAVVWTDLQVSLIYTKLLLITGLGCSPPSLWWLWLLFYSKPGFDFYCIYIYRSNIVPHHKISNFEKSKVCNDQNGTKCVLNCVINSTIKQITIFVFTYNTWVLCLTPSMVLVYIHTPTHPSRLSVTLKFQQISWHKC